MYCRTAISVNVRNIRIISLAFSDNKTYNIHILGGGVAAVDFTVVMLRCEVFL